VNFVSFYKSIFFYFDVFFVFLLYSLSKRDLIPAKKPGNILGILISFLLNQKYL